MQKNSHCSYCGHPFESGAVWPRTCAMCHRTTFRNPVPVAVLLVPVDAGLLVIRRGIEPHRGGLALPGGYIDLEETWQEAAVRELAEETGLRVDAREVKDVCALSAPDGTVLIFGLVPGRSKAALFELQLSAETTECLVIDTPTELAFPLHTQVVNEFFARRANEAR